MVALGLVHGAVWLKSEARLSNLLHEQVNTLRGQGWRIALGSVERSGWPVRAGIGTGPVSVALEGLVWRAERVIADTALLRPSPATMRVSGQRVRLGHGLERAVTSQDWRIERVADGAVLTGTEMNVANLFKAQALQAQLGPGSLTVRAWHLQPLDVTGAFGPIIDTVTLRAVLTSPIPSAGDPSAAAPASPPIGRTANLSEFALTTGGFSASGQARLWLDDALQPNLEGVVHLAGYAAGLNGLVAAGVLPSDVATAAEAVLGLLAAPSPDGGVDLPVRVAEGILVVAQFPLLRLPVLEWSGPNAAP